MFKANYKRSGSNHIHFLKARSILLRENYENEALKTIKRRVNIQNVATYYQIAKHFNCETLANRSFRYIELFFSIVCKTRSFLEIDFKELLMIITSSELHIDSELEVITAGDSWIKHDFENRRKYVKYLSLKIRLSMLPDNQLDSIAKMKMSLNEIDDCVVLIREVSQNKKSIYQNKSNSLNSIRCFSKNLFNIIVIGGHTFEGKKVILHNSVQEINSKDYCVVKNLCPMKKRRYNHKVIYCRGHVYVLGGYDENRKFVFPVEKYSLTTNKWEQIAEMGKNRRCFSACAFIDNILLIGGYSSSSSSYLNSLMKLDTNDDKWIRGNRTSRMNAARGYSACAVFKGRIVVTGGCNMSNFLGTNTVEAYDHLSETWSSMPSMIERRYSHTSVSISNKLYVMGLNDFQQGKERCEVFDSVCNKFVALKNIPTQLTNGFFNLAETFSTGKKLIMITQNSTSAIIYDVENDVWSEEDFQKRSLFSFGSTIIPQMQFQIDN